MSQTGTSIKLLVSAGKITISYTNYVFENATKNFVNTTKEPVYKAHGLNRLAENYTNTTLCGRKQAAIKRKTDAVEHRLEHPGKKGDHTGCETPLSAFFEGGGKLRPSAGRTSPQGTGGDRPSSARKAPPGSRRSPCPRQGSSGALPYRGRRDSCGGIRQRRGIPTAAVQISPNLYSRTGRTGHP